MNRFFLRSVGAIAIVGFFLAALSCAHDQQLVSISVIPNGETFGASNIPVPDDAGLSVQLRALGHYIHPPVTKDITNEVVWGSNDPQMVIVNSTGLATAVGDACGTTIISATVTNNFSAGNRPSTGALVTGSMTANVVCFTGTTNGNATLTVTFAGTGTGSITASPGNNFCSATCGITFPAGTGPITLTAATNGTFAGWQGCDTQNVTVCTINSLITNRDVIVTFN
jgi:hypothetical protein